MTDNNDRLQTIDRPNVLCCPHLQDKQKTRMGFPKFGGYRSPLSLVGEGNFLVLCDDCRDKLELAFLREWMQPVVTSRRVRQVSAETGYSAVRVPTRGNGDE
jgi:hypothetical protein